MSAVALSGPPEAERGSEVSRWGASFAIVLGLHAAALFAMVTYKAAPIERGDALPAVMIDMAPPPAAPDVASADAPPQEAVPEAAMPDPVVDAAPHIPEPEPTPPIVTAAVSPPEPQPQVQPVQEAVTPPPVVRESAAVALPPPTPKPAPPPVRRAVEKRSETKKPPKLVQAKRAELQQGARRPPQNAAGSQTTASIASGSSSSSAASRAGWQGAIVAALNRAKRPQQNSGTASVRFSVDRGGRVLSASLAGSTGVAGLDQEAVSLVRRANIPAPPGDVPGEAFTFTVPIRFTQQ